MAEDKCSDPYGTGCRATATGSMRGQAFGRYDAFTDKDEIIETTIYLCDTCGYWNSDWDWDAAPEGPFITNKP